MSRYYDDCDGEDFPNQAALWEANYERALDGRKGRKTLADLREALMALPEHRLIEGALCTVGAQAEEAALRERAVPDSGPGWSSARMDAASLRDAIDSQGEGVCAIGAYLWHRNVKAGMDPDAAFTALPRLLQDDHDISDTALAAREVGVTFVLAYRLAYRNDETYGAMTPEERWEAFVAWIDKQLATAAA